MNFYISYFYKIRFMTDNILPISTAMWDPLWYHEGTKNRFHLYLNNNGTIIGGRSESLVMPQYEYNKLVLSNLDCANNCPFNEVDRNGKNMCVFMQRYYDFLHKKNTNFDEFIRQCESYAHILEKQFNKNIDTVIFIVHEPPYRACGERPVLQKWFLENGLELKEWSEK